MLTKKYTGVCIGGIADGRTYAHDKPEMTVSPQQKLPDGSFSEIKGRTEYKFLLLLGNEAAWADIGVWVPDGSQIEDVVKRLTANYRPLGMMQRPLV